MRPDPDRLLEVAAIHLMTKTGPAVDSAYEQSSLMVLALMLSGLREEHERAAARRIEENRALREIFAEAQAVVEDDELGGRLVRAAGGDDRDFAISALERTNCELRGLLIELHAYVEELTSPESRELESLIWRELVASTERRKLAMGVF